MTKYALPLALLAALMLTSACRHRSGKSIWRYSNEEATPVSSLPEHEFSGVSPARAGKRR